MCSVGVCGNFIIYLRLVLNSDITVKEPSIIINVELNKQTDHYSTVAARKSGACFCRQIAPFTDTINALDITYILRTQRYNHAMRFHIGGNRCTVMKLDGLCGGGAVRLSYQKIGS